MVWSVICFAADPVPAEREAIEGLQTFRATEMQAVNSAGRVLRVDLTDRDIENQFPTLYESDLPKVRRHLDALPKLKSVAVYFNLPSKTAPDHMRQLAGLEALEEVGLWTNSFDPPPIAPKHFEMIASGGNLKRLRVHGLNVREFLPAIVANEALEELTFDVPADDKMLAEISRARRLRKLEIAYREEWPPVKPKGPFITDAGAVHLGRLESLERLTLPVVALTDRGAEDLGKLVRLTHLEIRGGNLSEKGIAAIAGLANLRELKLNEVGIDDAGMKHLGDLQNLEVLSLYRDPVTDRGIDSLRKLTRLHTISVGLTQVTARRIVELRRELPSLRTANGGIPDGADPATIFLVWKKRGQVGFKDGKANSLQFASDRQGREEWAVTSAQLRGMKGMESLEWLNLHGHPVADDGLKAVGAWRKLHGLGLADSIVTDVGVKELANLSELQGLNLANTKVTDASMEVVAKLRDLETLSLEGTAVTDAGIARIAGLPKLRMVHLRKTKITDVSLKALAAMPSIQYLEIDDTDVTKAAIEEIRRARPKLHIPR